MRIIIIAGCILLTLYTHAQTCTLSSDTISRQGQVDSFNINYPSCNNIIGTLTITGSVSDLKPLVSITKVSGSLIIENTKLTDLNGLENIDSINTLILKGNAFLKNLQGLEGLEYINVISLESNIEILEINNISATNISNFSVSLCPKLKEIIGFNNSSQMTGINIADNAGLDRIDAFKEVEFINGIFRLYNNANLKQLNTATRLKMVHGFLEIVNLKNLSQLPTFDSLVIANQISIINLHEISKLPDFTNLKLVNGTFEIGSNYRLTKIPQFPSLKIIKGSLEIGLDLQIKDFDGFIVLDSIYGSLRFRELPGGNTEKISGFKKLKFIGLDFMVLGLYNLREITGFSSLKKVERVVALNSLHKIKNFNAFKNLEYIGTLQISRCLQLDDISGITGIDFNKLNYLTINYNDSLSYCHYEPICQYLKAKKGSYYVGFNKKGCNNADEILEACRTVGVDDDTATNITLSPNPTESDFLLTLSDYVPSDGQLVMYDMMGKVVHQQPVHFGLNKVDVTKLQTGTYLYQVSDGITTLKRGKLVRI